jgi:hypothetical protein
MKSKNQAFNMQLEKPVTKQLYDPPDDPLNEFTEFEMGLKRFCFDYNRHVLLEIDGAQIEDLYLYHDILDALEVGLIKQISVLSVRKNVFIDFADTLTLRFIPVEDEEKIICKLERIGSSQENSYLLNLSQVLTTLSRLVDEILNMAIAKGYITAADAQTELGWQHKTDG